MEPIRNRIIPLSPTPSYKVFMTLNGNKRIAPTNLKIKSSVRPMMRKGKSNNQRIGKRKMNKRANGQQRASKVNQSKMAKMVFMKMFAPCTAKD
jgi:hypothetical protein